MSEIGRKWTPKLKELESANIPIGPPGAVWIFAKMSFVFQGYLAPLIGAALPFGTAPKDYLKAL